MRLQIHSKLVPGFHSHKQSRDICETIKVNGNQKELFSLYIGMVSFFSISHTLRIQIANINNNSKQLSLIYTNSIFLDFIL